MINIKGWIRNRSCLWKYRKVSLKLGKGARITDRASFFEGFNSIGEGSDFRGAIGMCSYIGKNCHIHATIGRYTCISDRVHTVSGTHPSRTFVSIHPAFYSTKMQCGLSYVKEDCFEEVLCNPVDEKTTVYIGNDVWIGCDVTLIGGIEIGDGAIVAAGAVVTSDVEPYTVVAGVPAKPIRKRFTEDQIRYLQKFRWWDRDSSWLKEHSTDFRDIEKFLERHSL